MTPPPLARFVVVSALSLALLALAGCGLQPSARVVEPVGPALAQSFEAPAAGGVIQVVAPVAVGTLEVRAADLAFDQQALAVAAPGNYLIRLVNNDDVPHEVAFDDGTRLAAGPGQEAAALVTIPAEGTAFVCVLPEHRAAGMVGQVLVDE
jgi:uncharacterized cupredoxin-like copper-binding protein